MIPEHISKLLLPFQIPHVITLGNSIDRNPTTGDFSDPGTGKTSAACGLSAWKQRSLLVIAPKICVPNWFATAARFGVSLLGVSNYEAIKNGKYYETVEQYFADKRVDCPFIEINVDKDTPFKWDVPDDCLICFDEAHRGKNYGISINSQLIVSAKTTIEQGAKIIILSATITDKIECFKTVAILMGFAQEGKAAYNAWIRKIKKDNPGLIIEEIIHKILFPQFGSRMRIIDIKAQMRRMNQQQIFLENDVRAEVFDVSPETEKEITGAYNDINDALVKIKNKEKTEICYLTIILRARQRIELLKVPIIAMSAMEYLINDNSVVIFVNFNETIDQLFTILDDFVHEEFKSFITFIRGGQTNEDRKYNQDSFQSNKSRLLICNILAGGSGIDLHDTIGDFSCVSLISPPWSSIELQQSLGRIYRAGAKSSATQRIVYCKGKVSNNSKNQPGVGHEIDTGAEIIQITRDVVRLAPSKDTTFNGENGEKIGVEELMAINLNKKLKTIEFLNNGDIDDLTQL